MRMRGHSRITRDSGVVGDIDHGGMTDASARWRGCRDAAAKLTAPPLPPRPPSLFDPAPDCPAPCRPTPPPPGLPYEDETYPPAPPPPEPLGAAKDVSELCDQGKHRAHTMKDRTVSNTRGWLPDPVHLVE